jgi:hypothetical protein
MEVIRAPGLTAGQRFRFSLAAVLAMKVVGKSNEADTAEP